MIASKLVEFATTEVSKVKYVTGETSAGLVAKLLDVPQCKVSLALTKLPCTPKPVRLQGNVRIYSIADISDWILHLGGITKAATTIRTIKQNQSYEIVRTSDIPYTREDKMNKAKTKIAIDLETTGLDASVDLILEATCIVLDDNLEEVERFHSVFRASELELDNLCDAWVFNTHTDNGLIAESIASTANTTKLFDFLRKFDSIVFLGSSVHFDVGFLMQNAPKDVIDKFHYRQIDVSALLELVPSIPVPPKSEKHRSTEDIERSIAIARTFRDLILNR